MVLTILLVDDHYMITDFYETALAYSEIEKIITVKNTLETAYNFIFSEVNVQAINVIILDLSMPPFKEKNINNGEDLANLIRMKYPEIKIIIISSLFNTIQLERIIKNICPQGLIEKSDISSYEHFIEIFTKIINGKSYRSKIVDKMFNNNINKIHFDNTNRQIIILLSQGVKTKNIPKYIPITLSGVKKRKLKIKELLKIDFGDDEDIIRESKTLGII